MGLKSRVAARLDASYTKRHEYEELRRVVEDLRRESALPPGEQTPTRSDLEAALLTLNERLALAEADLMRTRSDLALLRHQTKDLVRLIDGRG